MNTVKKIFSVVSMSLMISFGFINAQSVNPVVRFVEVRNESNIPYEVKMGLYFCNDVVCAGNHSNAVTIQAHSTQPLHSPVGCEDFEGYLHSSMKLESFDTCIHVRALEVPKIMGFRSSSEIYLQDQIRVDTFFGCSSYYGETHLYPYEDSEKECFVIVIHNDYSIVLERQPIFRLVAYSDVVQNQRNK